MPVDLSKSFVVGISSRALFGLDAEDKIFRTQGLDAYSKYQIDKAENVLEPGNGFGLVKALLGINANLVDKKNRQTEVVVVSRNGPATSLRIFRSIEHHGLDIRRVSLSGGQPNAKYLKAYNVGLYLSAHAEDVRDALAAGIPAGLIYTEPTKRNQQIEQIRIAFDGDAVIFSDESEKVYQKHGLDHFNENEKRLVRQPLKDGPFAPLLRALSRMQNVQVGGTPPVRVALVTARGRMAGERVIRTLMAWNVRVDEAHFMDGVEKTAILQAFDPHIFFDDQESHCTRAAGVVPTAQVPRISLPILSPSVPAASVEALLQGLNETVGPKAGAVIDRDVQLVATTTVPATN